MSCLKNKKKRKEKKLYFHICDYETVVIFSQHGSKFHENELTIQDNSIFSMIKKNLSTSKKARRQKLNTLLFTDQQF
jgi:hypothetical protein